MLRSSVRGSSSLVAPWLTRLHDARPEKLSAKTKKTLVALVVKERGSYVVTRKFCQKRIPALRKVSVQTVGRALHDAGLAWLRRRMKRVVPKAARKARVAYAKAPLRPRRPHFHLAGDFRDAQGNPRRHRWKQTRDHLARVHNIHVRIGMRAGRQGLWFHASGRSWAAQEVPLPGVPGAHWPAHWPGRFHWPRTHLPHWPVIS